MSELTVFLSVWAAVGPLIGVVLGSWLATKSQRKHWELDNKRAEYRELLATIADAGGKFVVHYGFTPVVAGPEEQFRIGEAARTSVDVIYNRLFIARVVRDLNVLKRWEDAISALRNTHDINAFGKAMDGIMEDIRNAALKDFC